MCACGTVWGTVPFGHSAGEQEVAHALVGAMFSIDWDNPAYLWVRANGRLNASDYDWFEPRFSSELGRRGGRAPLLLDVRGWRGWTPGGFVRDFLFNLRNRNSFPRIAVLGDRPWHKWLTYAAKPVFSGKCGILRRRRRRKRWSG